MKTLRIKDICDKGSSNLKQKDVENQNGVYPVFGASGLIGKIDTYHQNKDYIAIVKDGSGIGRVTFMPAFSSVIGTLQYILPKEGFNIKYISYCLQSLDLAHYKQGAAIPHIYFRDYGEYEVNVEENPDDQQRIVSYLDSEFAKIEALKANAEKQLQAAKDLFQAALKELLTPKEGWVEKKLGDYATLITKGASPKWQGFQYQNSGIPFITSENVRDGFIDISPRKFLPRDFNAKQKRSILKKHDVLVNIVGASIGRAAIFDLDYSDANINQAVALVRCNAKIEVKYLCMFLNSEMASKQYDFYKKDSARANLSLENISSLSISCPSLPEQQRIADRLDALSANVKALQTNYTETIPLCNNLKQALLKKVFG